MSNVIGNITLLQKSNVSDNTAYPVRKIYISKECENFSTQIRPGRTWDIPKRYAKNFSSTEI